MESLILVFEAWLVVDDDGTAMLERMIIVRKLNLQWRAVSYNSAPSLTICTVVIAVA